MPVTDTTEKGLESLMVESLVGSGHARTGLSAIHDAPVGPPEIPHYVSGDSNDYDRDHALDLAKLLTFLETTQPKAVESLDLGIFINGLPVATFELKNKLTKQTVEDAIHQYKRDHDSKELLFQFGRCVVHFAVDDHQVWMCTKLGDEKSWFLPFNKGWNDGAGNPPNPHGLATDYLWKEVLQPASLTNIIENYAQVVEEIDRKGKKKRTQIFPRYHQLELVRLLLAHVGAHGVGHRYLVQHSAGSGKSNSIAWTAHQLVELKDRSADRAVRAPLFDSVIVVTDRRVLDRQIRENIRHFASVSAVVGEAKHSGDLRKFIEAGKNIIITTIQKFPFILDFVNDAETIQKAFEPYYRATILIMQFLSKEIVSLEYRNQLQQDLARTKVCRFLVAYVSLEGMEKVGRHLLNRALRDGRSFGVASLSCSCGYEPLLKLQSELPATVGVCLKYFMDPMVRDADDAGYLALFHSKAGLNSQLRGTNQSTAPIAGFEAVILDETELLAFRNSARETRSPVRIWSGRDVKVFDFEFPTQQANSGQVDGGIEPKYQFHLEVEHVVFPADRLGPDRPELVWEPETFAVAEKRESARMEEKPGFYVEPRTKEAILKCLREVLLIDLESARVLPYSETDLPKVGKRVSEHPLHETYIGEKEREHRHALYQKAEQGTLIPELDESAQAERRERRSRPHSLPIPRSQRVFTMPLEDLLERWTRARP